jgi:stage II sporulation protein D
VKSSLLALGAALLLAGCSAHRLNPRHGDLKIIEKKNDQAVSLAPRETMRVGIRVDVESATISCESDFLVEDLIKKKSEKWLAGPHPVTAAKVKGKKLWMSIPTGDSYFQVGENKYRGSLIVTESGGRVTVINELGIDDYLKGVLPREVTVTWPDEALKVQAVASRTYLAAHLDKHGAQGFDLCSDVHCQVYGGMTKEHPKTTAAVDNTRGEILIYKDKPIGAYFYAFCGGSTEKIRPVWGNDDQPYLPQKKCRYCVGNPRYVWKLTVHDDDILKALLKADLVKGTALKNISVKKKSGSARAEIVTVKTDAGSFDMRGNAFRIAMNPEKIRSTLWTHLKKRDGGIYEFEGKGWGHGVGMCQWGAKGQAEHGRSYTDILSFYYPGSHIEQWKR